MSTRDGNDADVLVVGGGPAGSATACFLAARGVDVLLLDRAHFPRDKACSEYLSPEASRVLDAMGVLSKVESAGGAQLSGMMVRSPRGESCRGYFAGSHGFHGFRDTGLALRRTILDSILLDHARGAGARVREGARVIDVQMEAGRAVGAVVADADGGRAVIRSRFVVGADGLRSIVSRRLGLARRSRWPSRIALVGHFTDVTGVGEVGEMHVDAQGYLGIAPVGGGMVNVGIVVPVSRAKDIAGGRPEFLQKWIDDRPHLRERFAGARAVSPVRATGPFASAVRRAWAPGAAVVGDAADFFDPFTGEGIYAALRGGEMLSGFVLEALAADPRSADASLSAYDRARRAEFGGKWKLERLAAAAVAFPAMMNRAVHVLSRRADLADLFVGVAGDFVPPREVLRLSTLRYLLAPGS
ncbi:MAG TPA: NAD(P)/FAD-dependent oxidoreductase [Gemmatimonadaceae bacterium]|nr:NAD(P)/FAD-dependent oxidoreductase [Gemmatimonadaceae bacterium]